MAALASAAAPMRTMAAGAPSPTLHHGCVVAGTGRPDGIVAPRLRSFSGVQKMIVLPELNQFGGSVSFTMSRGVLSSSSTPGVVVRQGLSRDNSSDAAPEFTRRDIVQDELLVERLPYGVIHKKGDVVVGKYTITGVFGQGAMGVTYEAERTDGEVVALKAMSLRNMKGWKELDLFEREARVLKSLNHPGIPAYIDYFEVDTDVDRIFYIAQRAAKGKSLEDLVTGGWRVSEEKVKRIALEILTVLQYLGDLRPPVIHRDIKPENIILDEETGNVKVVDFGAVQDVASSTLIGSTVVGTYGYMAPEQFQNRATLQTDLYGLGGTMLYMLSGRPPSYFPQRRLKVEFRDLVTMSAGLANVVDRLLEPAPEDRFQSPSQVIQALQEDSYSMPSRTTENLARNPQQISNVRRPADTQVELRRTSNKLEVVIPANGLTQETAESGAFTVAWNAFVAVWTRSAIAGGGPVFAAFSLPFWFVGLRLAKRTLFSTAVAIRLEFDGPQFTIEWSIGKMWKKQVVGEVQNIHTVDIMVEEVQDPDQGYNKRLAKAAFLKEGKQQHVFGSALQPEELEWLVSEIKSHLQLSS
ncbi:hypothetical protein M758_10G102700 [Ceratodon purpureus]|uniref:non-specific serine/threonine protein kinase n=1 Tax=Ceratodon purpureus TaxID=3225 RepID=A0A8T0GR44_CERPU|nr:hypothetical protein KC19_10G105900 [Ceratodon purpureus]KAG0603561.1 hypothetical protein M758_10G102700 [Ceratodon purpureus]